MDFVVVCPACSKRHAFTGTLSFREECACGQDLHVCHTCKFHDRYAENECREPTADPVAEKARRNLCEDWRPRVEGDASTSEADRAKAKLAALFGERPATSTTTSPTDAPSSADEARARLEALFKKK